MPLPPSAFPQGTPVSAAPLEPPVAPRRPHVTELHGERREDPWAWLRHRDDPDVIRYLEAENAYTEAMTAHTAELRERLYREMLGRIQETDLGVPVRRDDYFYYTRTEEGKAYPIHARKRGSLDAVEEIVLDQNAEAAGLEYFQLGGMEVSPDHRYVAALVDTSGYEDFELRVRDIAAGEWLPDRIGPLGFGLAWASDGATIFYTTTDPAKRSDRAWRHRVGTGRAEDVLAYHEPDVLFNLHVDRSKSGDYVVLATSSFTSGEVSVVDAHHPERPARLIIPRRPGIEVALDHQGGRFLIHSNEDARNFAIWSAPVDAPERENWTPFLPHREDVFVEDFEVFRDWVVVEERHDGLRRLRVERTADREVHYVSFPEPAYGVYAGPNPEYASGTLRFTYSSLTTPPSVFDYDLAARSRVLMKEEPVLGGYDRTQYEVERLMVTARDGARVPVSLVRRKPWVRDGVRPLLLYGYGSYGYTLEPTFSSTRLSLLDRGFTYAIAHVRGGQEMGRAWYDDGKMMKKLNTFHDFIDVAEHLVRERYTSPERLVANGGSAGGLLMGAVANLRPDLFRAIVADVPFVDVINTMLDASIPLTAQEWEQWGNPAEREAYEYMRRYSPWDNVTAQAYPWMLVMSGINDPRVHFWEPAKWVARLRAQKTDSNPLLLRMEMGSGHGGSSGRYERLKEQAFRFAFILDSVGLATEEVP
jgi:oligopeptidase B